MNIISNIKKVFADSSKKKVLVIPIYGTITESQTHNFSKSFSAFELTQDLFDIANDCNYDGIILRINSPGGAASASEEVTHAIRAVRNSHIPIVTTIGDLCASGAYLIASATDKIFANKMSLVGSIGAIMQIPNFTNLSEKLGVKLITATSGKMKDIGNPSREITPEEKLYLDTLVKTAAKQFIEIVQKNRNSVANTQEMFDGRVVSAQEALDNNLIDAIGTYYDAIQYICKRLDIDNERLQIIEYNVKSSLMQKILSKLEFPLSASFGLKF